MQTSWEWGEGCRDLGVGLKEGGSGKLIIRSLTHPSASTSVMGLCFKMWDECVPPGSQGPTQNYIGELSTF